ncbi:hypothetical protein EV424DRAFT_1352509 [Suillus variegatus]|nr:hypothetical protein EV424DRAFT_1352509 [Suillus variegatus]
MGCKTNLEWSWVGGVWNELSVHPFTYELTSSIAGKNRPLVTEAGVIGGGVFSAEEIPLSEGSSLRCELRRKEVTQKLKNILIEETMGDCLMEGGNCCGVSERKMERSVSGLNISPGFNRRLVFCEYSQHCMQQSSKGSEFLRLTATLSSLPKANSTCWPHEARPQQLPVPPGLRGSHPSTSDTTGHFHPRSGYVFGLGKNLFDRLQEDQYNYQRKFNTHPKPFFTSKDQLLDWMDALPCFAEWKVSNLEFTGYKTIHPIQLIWRDALEVVKQLFSDPIFANHITFQPHIVNVKNQREYGDYMSADLAWKIQDCLPLGATQVPIILGSDKTPVTRTTGGLEMHPIFITIGNLDSEARLWHKCVDLVCANLKLAAKTGCFMTDPSKLIRYVFTPLVAHVCDLPEACMVATVSKNVSPLTMALQENFGDGVLYPPHTGQHTLQLICEISKMIDVLDLDKFQKAAKAVNLSGVHMPYWRDWMFACPSVFLAGEILHTCLKFFADHLLNWTKEVVGKPELDARFITQHKRVGTRHFTKGITHINQMTGREHRDIQRTIVASIAGAAPPRFIRALHALVEFIYLAQNPVHSADTLLSMTQALSAFHTFKDAIIEAQARRGKKGSKEDFFIPKLELLQSFRGTVERLGTLMQFSADMTDRELHGYG